jgi:pre-rRNA-processing protein TSR1
LNRRNQAKQIQLAKRYALIEATRIFNGVDGAPRIVAVVPLTDDVTAKGVVKRFCEALDVVDFTECPAFGVWKMK